MTAGRVTNEELAEARQRLRQSRAAKGTPDVARSRHELWASVWRVSSSAGLLDVRHAAQALKASHFAAGWTEHESMSEAIEILGALVDTMRLPIGATPLAAGRLLPLLTAIADGFGLDLD